MKTYLLIFIALGFVMQSYAQQNLTEKDLPAGVLTSFKADFPMVKDAKWTKEGIYYESSFKKNDMEKMVTYDASGKLIRSQTEIESAALPASAATYVKQHYDKDQVSKAFKVTDSRNTVTYEAEVRGDELNFDSEGNIISSKQD